MDFSILNEIIKLSKDFSVPYDKETVVDAIVKKFNLSAKRKIFQNKDISIRFSNVKNGGYSNTFLGFRQILENDDKPLIACIIRTNEIEFLIANSTFVTRISHSSKILELLKIRGSVNLSNIIKSFSGYSNEPKNFEELFKLHSEIPQEDNIERVVENTKLIKAKKERFNITDEQQKIILGNIQFIKNIEEDSDFIKMNNELIKKVEDLKNEILEIAESRNVNIRGNLIEQLITKGKNSHELGDILTIIKNNHIIIIDIKSKLLNSSSAPKAYNIDKLLETISNEKTYFGYLFIGIDDKNNEVKVKLVSFIDKFLINNTKIQHHWSSKNSRGTTQLVGNIKNIFETNFTSEIDLEQSKTFIEMLINL